MRRTPKPSFTVTVPRAATHMPAGGTEGTVMNPSEEEIITVRPSCRQRSVCQGG
jgi:hypothetical protein